MAISLSKGGNISLSKEAPSMKNLLIGLGWDLRATDGAAFDLDASLFMIKEDGKVRSESDFIFYNQKNSSCGSVKHLGDNRTGEGIGDDEMIEVELDKVPQEIKKLVVAVTIHDAEERGQNFGMVSSAFIRVMNKDNNTEIARYDLSEDASLNRAILFGEVYRHNAEWKFKAVGQGFEGGLGPLSHSFGINA